MTSLPNLPTDNLYKFLFISGLTMILSGVLFGFSQYNKVSEKINSVELSVANDNLEYAFLLEDAKELYAESKALRSKTENEDSLRLLFSGDFNLLRTEIDSIGEANKPLELKIRQAKVHSTTTSLNGKFLKEDYRLLKLTTFISFLACIVGYYLAKKGYNKWEGLVQKPLDEKLKLEVDELRGKIEKQK